MDENIVFSVGGTKHGPSPFLPEELLFALAVGLLLTFVSELVVGLVVGGVTLFALLAWRKKAFGRQDYVRAFLRLRLNRFKATSPAESDPAYRRFAIAQEHPRGRA